MVDAAAKIAEGGPADASATAESDFYASGRVRLKAAGMKVEEAGEELILGVPFGLGPKVILRPSFAMSLDDCREKVSGGSISGESTLIIDGADITLEDVQLSGSTALVVKACKGAKVTVKGPFSNDGFELVDKLKKLAFVPDIRQEIGQRCTISCLRFRMVVESSCQYSHGANGYGRLVFEEAKTGISECRIGAPWNEVELTGCRVFVHVEVVEVLNIPIPVSYKAFHCPKSQEGVDVYQLSHGF